MYKNKLLFSLIFVSLLSFIVGCNRERINPYDPESSNYQGPTSSGITDTEGEVTFTLEDGEKIVAHFCDFLTEEPISGLNTYLFTSNNDSILFFFVADTSLAYYHRFCSAKRFSKWDFSFHLLPTSEGLSIGEFYKLLHTISLLASSDLYRQTILPWFFDLWTTTTFSQLNTKLEEYFEQEPEIKLVELGFSVGGEVYLYLIDAFSDELIPWIYDKYGLIGYTGPERFEIWALEQWAGPSWFIVVIPLDPPSGGGGNNPPNTPSTPWGQSSGDVGTSYEFSTSTTDPDNDNVAYRFDWGNSNISGWTFFVSSGSSASKSYSWSTGGTYYVKAQAKDIDGATSGWSSGHQIDISGGTPHTVTIQPGPSDGKDTYVTTLDSTANFGSDSLLWASAYISSNWWEHILIQFPLGVIPSGADIDSAKLWLYGTLDTGPQNAWYDIKEVTGSWSEETVNWMNKPPIENTIASMEGDCHISWYIWDITSVVQDWVNGILSNYGIYITSTAYGTAGLNSSDHADSSKRPKLVVTYRE